MQQENWFVKHKKLVIVCIIIALLFLIFGGTKIYLTIKLLLGSDIVVSLVADKEDISLARDQIEEVNFKSSVTANPFCQAKCVSKFEDLSRNNTIETYSFTIQPGIPVNKKYRLSAPQFGQGIDLYRFSMSCKTEETLLCHTFGQETTRTALLTVSYNLTDEEKVYKNKLIQETNNSIKLLNGLIDLSNSLSSNLANFEKMKIPNSFRDDLIFQQQKINQTIFLLEEVSSSWKIQDYYSTDSNLAKFKSELNEIQPQLEHMNQTFFITAQQYNSIIFNLSESYNLIYDLKSFPQFNQIIYNNIRNLIQEYNSVLTSMTKTSSLDEKQKLATQHYENAKLMNVSIRESLKKEYFSKALQVDLMLDVLCNLTMICQSHPNIETRAQEQIYNLTAACNYISNSRNIILTINNSLADEFKSQNYTTDFSFWEDIKTKVINSKQKNINEYKSRIFSNDLNYVVLNDLLVSNSFVNTPEYSQHNLKSAYVKEILNQYPADCNYLNGIYPELIQYNLPLINLNTTQYEKSNFSFILQEIPSQCCIFGSCNSCFNKKEIYPVIIVPGHAFNKDLSAEYSLEGFNSIQDRLEKDGYLNAGAITAYTTQNMKKGILGEFDTRYSLRVSYYFDVFKHPENYVVVQGKSENIESYAIRLREIIKTVKYRTGKDKVNIIAFSMGGLVSRRYLQLFGEDDVNQLIMIGTPNKGISGDIKNSCSLVGSNLECQDMNADSLFMNKLNSQKLPNIKMHTIVGTGCRMSDGIGDGIVLVNSSLLPEVNFTIINGTCTNPVRPLHLEMLDINKYPVVYDTIINQLRN